VNGNNLTAREHEVATLVARGLSNKEVALQLGLSDGTVKLHMHKILKKLGARNRYALCFSLAVRGSLPCSRLPVS
jgi:DNA-binding NarL/FixJ family response regulator